MKHHADRLLLYSDRCECDDCIAHHAARLSRRSRGQESNMTNKEVMAYLMKRGYIILSSGISIDIGPGDAGMPQEDHGDE